MSSPFIANLAMFWKPLPMVVLGVPTIISAILVLRLPETSGTSLPETMEETLELDERKMGKKYEPLRNQDA